MKDGIISAANQGSVDGLRVLAGSSVCYPFIRQCLNNDSTEKWFWQALQRPQVEGKAFANDSGTGAQPGVTQLK